MDKYNQPFKEKEQHVQDILRAITVIQPVVPMLKERTNQLILLKTVRNQIKIFSEQLDLFEKTLVLFENADLRKISFDVKEQLSAARSNEVLLSSNVNTLNRKIDEYISYAETVYLTDSVFEELVRNYNSKWSTDKFLAMLIIISFKKPNISGYYDPWWAKIYLIGKMKEQHATRQSKKRITMLERIKAEGDDYHNEIIEYIENH